MELYDVKDEEYLSYLKNLCLADLPVPFYNKNLYHIKVKDIFMMGEELYSSLIKPIRLNSEALLGELQVGEERFLLDVLLADDTQMDYCLELLKIIFKTNNVKMSEIQNDNMKGLHREIIIDDVLWLDKYKFEQISEIIQKMCYLKKITKDDIKGETKEKKLTYEQIMSIKDTREREYQLAIYNKNKKEDNQKQKVIGLYSVYNYVCHASNIIDYDKPLNFNLYQLYNTYKILHKAEKYRYDMRLMASGMISDLKKMDTRWFNERIVEE